MSERITGLAETLYTDDALFALQSLESVVVDPSLVSSSEAFDDFNSAT